MSDYTAITAENAESFIGRRVKFHWGAQHGWSEDYTVASVRTNRFGTELIVLNEEGAEKSLSGFTTGNRIGAHLVGEEA